MTYILQGKPAVQATVVIVRIDPTLAIWRLVPIESEETAPVFENRFLNSAYNRISFILLKGRVRQKFAALRQNAYLRPPYLSPPYLGTAYLGMAYLGTAYLEIA
jgi:hypothetical protein